MELGVEGERVHSWRCEGEESALVEVWRRECTRWRCGSRGRECTREGE